MFVLAGLDSDQLIAAAITRAREQGGEDWRDQLWNRPARRRLSGVGAPRPPPHPLTPRLGTLPPIPPQPAEEIEDDEHAAAQPRRLTGGHRHPYRRAARPLGRPPNRKEPVVSTLTLAPAQDRAALSSLRVPPRLPENHRGEPLRHLSYSGITKFRGCPDDFRRSYILGAWGPKSGDMFVGSRVDDAISGYFRQRYGRHDPRHRRRQGPLQRAVEARARVRGRTQRPGPLRHQTQPASRPTRSASRRCRSRWSTLVPHLGRPIAVQRRNSSSSSTSASSGRSSAPSISKRSANRPST